MRAPVLSRLPAATVAALAALSLVVFTVLTTVSLVAWFAWADDPWTWPAGVASLSAAGAAAVALGLWSKPQRPLALAGLGVLILSLLRVGSMSSWTTSSAILICVTLVLGMPVVHAAIVLPRE